MIGYTHAGIYEPHFWAFDVTDMRYCERIGAAAVTDVAYVSGVAIYVPFVLSIASTVYEWFWMNGTLTTAHNIDFGIYNTDFTKIQSLGSTVGTTTASVMIQTTTWTNLDLKPGTYYMAMANDSTRNFSMVADAKSIHQSSGIVQQTGISSTLPDPMVPIAYTRAFLPLFGMILRATPV